MELPKYCYRELPGKHYVKEVILSETNKSKLESFLREYEARERFAEYGLYNMNRLFFYGASGTGKTFLTQCLAYEYNLTLLAVNMGLIMDSSTPTVLLADIFEYANETKNCIVFFDECDTVCVDRSKAKSIDAEKLKRVQEFIFQEVDRFDVSNLLIATTNLIDQIDPAFKRRFDISMKFESPEIKDIDDSIKSFVHPAFNLICDMDEKHHSLIKRELLERPNLSFFEIKNWVLRTMKEAVLENTTTITMTAIYDKALIFLGLKILTNSDGQVYLYKEGEKL